jgi:ArsR family transcriptional regulator, arsenate/arsenite/antimonite-responsive transcriptional repressor
VIGRVEDPTRRASARPAQGGAWVSSLRRLAELAELAEWLKVLGEPNRLKLVALLMQGEQCNCEMGGKLGMAPNLISHHLSILQKAGLVTARRDESDARWIHYAIVPRALSDLHNSFSAVLNPAHLRSYDATSVRCAPGTFASRIETTTR